MIIIPIQSQLFPISFPVFRLLTLVMLVMMLVFFFRLPAGKAACPRYVKKGDGLQYPGRLFIGIVLYSFVVDIMMLGGPAAVAEVPNGVFVAYLADAVGGVVLYALYRTMKIHPLDIVSVFMGGR